MEEALEEITRLRTQLAERQSPDDQIPIAIVGMGCRFPGGASTPAQFWEGLTQTVSAETEVPVERWDIETWYDADRAAPGRMNTRYSCFLDQIDQFDPAFFNIAPREALSMDPQQRLLLEVTWEALEAANIVPASLFDSLTGVFVGISERNYRALCNAGGAADVRDNLYSSTGNALSVAAGRLAHILGLTGPALAIDTACSSSLVAIHQACQSLRQRECDLALTGGVGLLVDPQDSVVFAKAGMLAPDGQCKTFDATADGYVRGEGCGMIVLKRLADAQAAGDKVLAVIRGSMVNHDGHSSGLTAPRGPSQVAVIRAALDRAGVTPDAVSYVEAHGTGTSLGDPIEMGALGEVFGHRETPLWVGSVKTHIGHLEAAAGVAGLMKVVLMLQHQQISPHLHFSTPSPRIDWANLPVRIPTGLIPWSSTQTGGQISGVSSFSYCGTNAHLIVAAAPHQPAEARSAEQRPCHLLNLSAQTEPALRALVQSYIDWFTARPEIHPGDLCYTARHARSQFDHRLSVVATSAAQMQAKLQGWLAGETPAGVIPGPQQASQAEPVVGFLFTGQGSQYVGMGCELYTTQPLFRATLDECDAILQPLLEGASILEVINDPQTDRIDQTIYTQPALFVLEVALARLWQAWGVQPDCLIGHSVGEVAAACVAGVFSLADGLQLIAARARLMQALPQTGAMVACLTDVARVQIAIAEYSDEVSIAAINGPTSVVISGATNAVQAIVEQLEKEKIRTRPLTVSHAFHSPLMAPMLAAFRAVATSITYAEPTVPLVSNLTGELAGDDISTPDYWVRHVREAVRFADGMTCLHAQGVDTFLEIGPKPVLLGMGRRCLSEDSGLWLPSLRPDQDWSQLSASLGELYVRGAPVDWVAFDQDEVRQKIALPTYPFQRERYWIDAVPATNAATPAWADWLYQVNWQVQPVPEQTTAEAGDWLLIAQTDGAGAALLDQIPASTCTLLPIEYCLAAETSDRDWPAPELTTLSHVVYYAQADQSLPVPAQTLQLSTGLLHLIQQLARQGAEPRVWVITQQGQQVLADEVVDPAQAAIWGLLRTITAEYPALRCTGIDYPAGEAIANLRPQLQGAETERYIAVRGSVRYVARLGQYALPEVSALNPAYAASVPSGVTIRSVGSYLITGGLGALGVIIAEQLAAQGAQHLVLSGRRGRLPEHEQAIQRLETLGATVQVVSADVADEAEVARLLAACPQPLCGIVHAAGVSDNGRLNQQTTERFARVLAPKVNGAWHLHRLTGQMPLDFFICFSSIATLLQSGGQGNYAVANAFLDGLMAARQAYGLPGLSINWGPWAEAGIAASLAERAQVQMYAQGFRLIDPETGKQVFTRLLQHSTNLTQIGVFVLDWQILLARTGNDIAFYRDCDTHKAAESIPDMTDKLTIRDQMLTMGVTERDAHLMQHLRTSAAKVLGLSSADQVDPNHKFMDCGFDSLMIVELRNDLVSTCGLSLPETLAFDYPTLKLLHQHLTDTLWSDTLESPEKTTTISDLTQDELAALLSQEFSQQD